MGIEFDKVVADARELFWAMPSEPGLDGDGRLTYGSVFDAASSVIERVPFDGLLALTKEIITEELDDGVDLSSVGEFDEHPTLTDILIASCIQVVARRTKDDFKISEENKRRYDLLAELDES